MTLTKERPESDAKEAGAMKDCHSIANQMFCGSALAIGGISVIVLTYNSELVIAETLKSRPRDLR